MKRIISVVLAAMLLINLSGCMFGGGMRGHSDRGDSHERRGGGDRDGGHERRH